MEYWRWLGQGLLSNNSLRIHSYKTNSVSWLLFCLFKVDTKISKHKLHWLLQHYMQLSHENRDCTHSKLGTYSTGICWYHNIEYLLILHHFLNSVNGFLPLPHVWVYYGSYPTWLHGRSLQSEWHKVPYASKDIGSPQVFLHTSALHYLPTQVTLFSGKHKSLKFTMIQY